MKQCGTCYASETVRGALKHICHEIMVLLPHPKVPFHINSAKAFAFSPYRRL